MIESLLPMENLSSTANGYIRITEAPRDAMQGLPHMIPAEKKARLINAILKVGFDIVDFGSFVSPKAIPQLSDTAEVIRLLDLNGTSSKLMAIVGNTKGALQAAQFDEITYIGFPYSFSPTFLRLNINSTPEKALYTVEELKNICLKHKKKLLVYLSMAFGNPYGDPWHIDLILEHAAILQTLEVDTIALSDIIGVADGMLIEKVFRKLFSEVPHQDIGLHLHTRAHHWYEKVDAAYRAGCRRFDGVMSGLGGCPMAGYELVGNLNTAHLVEYCQKNNIPLQIDLNAFQEAMELAIRTYAGL